MLIGLEADLDIFSLFFSHILLDELFISMELSSLSVVFFELDLSWLDIK